MFAERQTQWKGKRGKPRCDGCRAHNLKCDRILPICNHCAWGQRECKYTPLPTPAHRGIPRCDRCRFHNLKCDRNLPECNNCQQDPDADCNYTPKKRHKVPTDPVAQPTAERLLHNSYASAGKSASFLVSEGPSGDRYPPTNNWIAEHPDGGPKGKLPAGMYELSSDSGGDDGGDDDILEVEGPFPPTGAPSGSLPPRDLQHSPYESWSGHHQPPQPHPAHPSYAVHPAHPVHSHPAHPHLAHPHPHPHPVHPAQPGHLAHPGHSSRHAHPVYPPHPAHSPNPPPHAHPPSHAAHTPAPPARPAHPAHAAHSPPAPQPPRPAKAIGPPPTTSNGGKHRVYDPRHLDPWYHAHYAPLPRHILQGIRTVNPADMPQRKVFDDTLIQFLSELAPELREVSAFAPETYSAIALAMKKGDLETLGDRVKGWIGYHHVRLGSRKFNLLVAPREDKYRMDTEEEEALLAAYMSEIDQEPFKPSAYAKSPQDGAAAFVRIPVSAQIYDVLVFAHKKHPSTIATLNEARNSGITGISWAMAELFYRLCPRCMAKLKASSGQ